MTATADLDDVPAKKGSKLPLILGIVLAVAGGGGGFFAVSQGMLFGGSAESSDAAGHETADNQDGEGDHGADGPATVAAFVPIDPLVISIPDGGGTRFLRFTSQLEVVPGKEEQVTSVMPRIVDVLNGYLRAVSLSEMADPTVLVRLRAQMLRRVQVVTGADQVTDLLIMEFVLN